MSSRNLQQPSALTSTLTPIPVDALQATQLNSAFPLSQEKKIKKRVSLPPQQESAILKQYQPKLKKLQPLRRNDQGHLETEESNKVTEIHIGPLDEDSLLLPKIQYSPMKRRERDRNKSTMATRIPPLGLPQKPPDIAEPEDKDIMIDTVASHPLENPGFWSKKQQQRLFDYDPWPLNEVSHGSSSPKRKKRAPSQQDSPSKKKKREKSIDPQVLLKQNREKAQYFSDMIYRKNVLKKLNNDFTQDKRKRASYYEASGDFKYARNTIASTFKKKFIMKQEEEEDAKTLKASSPTKSPRKSPEKSGSKKNTSGQGPKGSLPVSPGISMIMNEKGGYSSLQMRSRDTSKESLIKAGEMQLSAQPIVEPGQSLIHTPKRVEVDGQVADDDDEFDPVTLHDPIFKEQKLQLMAKAKQLLDRIDQNNEIEAEIQRHQKGSFRKLPTSQQFSMYNIAQASHPTTFGGYAIKGGFVENVDIVDPHGTATNSAEQEQAPAATKLPALERKTTRFQVLNEKYKTDKQRFRGSDFMVEKGKKEQMLRVRHLFDEADTFSLAKKAEPSKEDAKFAELRRRLEKYQRNPDIPPTTTISQTNEFDLPTVTGPPRAVSTLQTLQTTNSEKGIAHGLRTGGKRKKKCHSTMRRRFRSPKSNSPDEFIEPRLASKLVIDDKFSQRNQLKIGPRESKMIIPKQLEKSFSGVLSTSKSNTEIPSSTPGTTNQPSAGVFMLDKLKSALGSQFKQQQKKQEENAISENMKSIKDIFKSTIASKYQDAKEKLEVKKAEELQKQRRKSTLQPDGAVDQYKRRRLSKIQSVMEEHNISETDINSKNSYIFLQQQIHSNIQSGIQKLFKPKAEKTTPKSPESKQSSALSLNFNIGPKISILPLSTSNPPSEQQSPSQGELTEPRKLSPTLPFLPEIQEERSQSSHVPGPAEEAPTLFDLQKLIGEALNTSRNAESVSKTLSKSMVRSMSSDRSGSDDGEPKLTESQIASLKINHVEKNIELSSKINAIKEIQVFYRNSIRDKKIEKMQNFKNERESQFVEISKQQLDRWVDFKRRKYIAQQTYIEQIRRKERAKRLIKTISAAKAISKAAEAYEQNKEEKRKIFLKVLIYLRFCVLWNFRARKYGPEKMDSIFKNRIRAAFTFMGSTMFCGSFETIGLPKPKKEKKKKKDEQPNLARRKQLVRQDTLFGEDGSKVNIQNVRGIEAECRRILAFFFKKYWSIISLDRMSKQIRVFFQRVLFIQKRIKEKLMTLNAKCEVVRMHWNKVLFQLFKIAHARKDTAMLQLCKQITSAPLQVTDEAIKQYVKKCKEKHSLAFFQWRLHFSNSSSDPIELSEIITDRVNFMNKAHYRRKEFLHNLETLMGFPSHDQVTIKNMKPYEKIFLENQDRSFNITSFESIGWPDPFPKMFPPIAKKEPPRKTARDSKIMRKEFQKEMTETLEKRMSVKSSESVEPTSPVSPKKKKSTKGRTFDSKAIFADVQVEIEPKQAFRRIEEGDSSFDSSGNPSPGKVSSLSSSIIKAGTGVASPDEGATSGLKSALTRGSELKIKLMRWEREADYFDLAYKKSRLDQGNSPWVLYIPSNQVMFKLMWACIGIYNKTDLWFNQGVEEEEEQERQAKLLANMTDSEGEDD